MKIYFPQWQGSGSGVSIEHGAKAILDYLHDDSIIQVPLSKLPAGISRKQTHQINNFEAIVDQLKRLKEVIAKESPNEVQTIGGDCGLEIVPVSYLNRKYPNLGVIWFDAHADINLPRDSPSCNFHGMPLRTLLGEGEPDMDHLLFSQIEPHQIHYIGLRDIDETEKVRIKTGNIYSPKHTNIEELVNVLKAKHITHLYIHLDFDCLEPKEYNRTYYQVPNGLKIKEAEDYIKALQEKFNVVGRSVLESVATNPSELQPITGIVDLLLR